MTISFAFCAHVDVIKYRARADYLNFRPLPFVRSQNYKEPIVHHATVYNYKLQRRFIIAKNHFCGQRIQIAIHFTFHLFSRESS